jgi:hypothetical protein
MDAVEYLEQITRFSYLQRRLPHNISGLYTAIIASTGDRLHTLKPSRIDAIIAHPPSRSKWSADGHALILYAFARFRRTYLVINRLSGTLAQVYLEFGVLPVIQPVPTSYAVALKEYAPRIYNNLSRDGLLLYVAR